MPSTASRIDIYNMVLDTLEEAPVTSTTDGRPVTNWLNRNYEPTRDAELRSHTWNFAIKRKSLSVDTATPEFGWERQYQIPEDCIYVLPLTWDGKQNGQTIPYEVEGNRILTDAIAPIKVRYVRRVENEGEFDPLFVEALVAKLAFKMSHWLTGKSSFAERALGTYQTAMATARLFDSLETTQADVEAEDVINVRYQNARL